MSVTDAEDVAQTRRPGLWHNRNFGWLFATSSISFIGNQFSLVALPWLALKLTGNPSVLAATTALMTVPQLVLLLIGGAVADRYSSRTILTVTNGANATVLATLAITLALGALQTHTLLALTFLLGTSTAFAVPTTTSLLPRIVTPDLLTGANSILMIARHLAMLVGPIAAGSLIASTSASSGHMAPARFEEAAGVSTALLIDAATFLISALLIRFIRVPLSAQQATTSVLRSVIEGLHWLWNDRPLRTLLVYYGGIMLLVTGPTQIGIPILVDSKLGQGAPGLGILLAAMSLGTISGMAIAAVWSGRHAATLGTTILAVDIVGGAALVALANTHTLAPAAALCVLIGLGSGYVQIGLTTWIQQRIPVNLLGRAMSVMMLILLGAVTISAVVTGVLLTHLTIVTILSASGVLLVLIASLCLSNPTLRSIGSPAPLSDTTNV